MAESTPSLGDLEGRATSTAGLVAAPARARAMGERLKGVPRNLTDMLALADFERRARRHLPRAIYGFISGSVETGAAARDNLQAFSDYAFVPRALTVVANRDTSRTLFGRRYAAPFGIAPMGASALAAYRGDIALARAAAAANVPMILSGSSLIRLEEVREAGSPWYQAYQPGEPDRIEALVRRVEAAGFDTFVLTIDIQVPGNRENNVRSGYSLPLKPTPRLAWDGITHPAWLFGTFLRTLQRHGMPHFENMDAKRGPPILSRNLIREIGRRDQLNWEHVALLRRLWKGNLVIKGILAPEDARIAREHGVDGIMVSNHGGRQLDHAVSPLRMLPEIAAVSGGPPEKGGMTVMLDGGIRRGTDVLKALALGAHFVFLGRPFLFSACIGGEDGVRHAIAILSEEVDRDLALLGLREIGQVTSDCLRRIGGREDRVSRPIDPSPQPALV